MSVNETLRDEAIRHALQAEKYARGLANKIVRLLNASDDELVETIAKRLAKFEERGFDLGPATTKRLETLLEETRTINDSVYKKVGAGLSADLGDYAEYEAEWAAKGLSSALAIDHEINLPPATYLRTLVEKSPIDGHLLTSWTDHMSANRQGRVEQAIRLGLVQGQTSDEIVRRIAGTKAAQYSDGVLNISRKSAQTLVLTASSTVASNARGEVYKRNGNLIKSLKWLSTLDSRTSPVCQSRDGQTENENLVNAGEKLGLTESEASVQDQLAKYRLDALNAGATLNDLATAAWKTEEERLATALRTKAAFEGQAAAIAKAKDIAAHYSPSVDRNNRLANIGRDRSEFLEGADAAGLSKAVQKSVLSGMDDAIASIKAETIYEFSDAIKNIGDAFEGRFGKAINNIGKALDRITAASTGDLRGAGVLGNVADMLGGSVADGFKEANREVLGKLSDQLGKTFGLKGEFGKTLGKTMGQISAGAELGSMSGQLTSLLGMKGSKTGAQLGGAAGSMIGGPLGALVGGFVGSALGGLLKKTRWGTSEINVSDGQVVVGSTNGNKQAYKDNASTAVGGVGSSIAEIAAALGATISGDPSVTIGQYKGKWRVSNTGRTGKLKGKYADVKDFGDDSDSAIAYATFASIQQGILSGISAFSTKILKSATEDTFASVLDLATKFETLQSDLAALDDPLGASIDNINSSLDSMVKQMVAAGASASDLADVERYRSVQLAKLVEEQTSSLRDLQKTLNGEGSGATVMQRLNADLAEYAGYQANIEAGNAVDNDAYAKLANEIFGLAGDAYGTSTSQFQDIRSMLSSDTAAAIGTTTDRVTAAQDAALAAQQAAVDAAQQQVVEQSKTNSYLAMLVEQNVQVLSQSLRGNAYLNGKATAPTV
ncbi:hypothetical protein PX699_00180 [Sphingobium sp. H39-3-25]|uniref:hypothetical protein n=1 Tax=Sphingobium arseniciresistens TaxID=3030834 RepID=UPI0023BA1A1C|nr:hypothetical protein [Sphingobium arseniciresistens]